MHDYLSIFNAALNSKSSLLYKPLPIVQLNNIDEVDSHGYVIDYNNIKDNKSYYKYGLELINKCQISIVILSGGQSSRFDGHIKATLPFTIIKKKSLIQIIFEKLIYLFNKAGVYNNLNHPYVYVLSSIYNYDHIKEYLSNNNYFTLNSNRIILIKQDNVPSFTLDSHEYIKNPSSLTLDNSPCNNLVLSPNGNGNLFESLYKCRKFTERLDYMKFLHVFSIDNPMVKPIDPNYIGFASSLQDINVFNKCINRYGNENLGVFCQSNFPCVIEYTEIECAKFINDDTPLFGNMCDHLFTGKFIKRIFDDKLFNFMPYHAVRRKIPYWDYNLNKLVFPDEINGYKLELFIFDILKFANKTICLLVNREEEFSPIKLSSHCDLLNINAVQYRMSSICKNWLNMNGCNVEGICEISPIFTISGEELIKFKGMNFKSVYINDEGIPEEIDD